MSVWLALSRIALAVLLLLVVGVASWADTDSNRPSFANFWLALIGSAMFGAILAALHD